MNIRKLFLFASVYTTVCLSAALTLLSHQASALKIDTSGDAENIDSHFSVPQLNYSNVLDNAYTDDKRTRTTSKDFPFSAVGKLENADGSYCTATLVGKDLIVTAAHCIMNDAGGSLVQGNYVFTPLYGNGSKLSAGVSHFWWGTKYPDQNREADWALLRLDKPLGNNFGYMGVQSFANAASLLGKGIIWMSAYSSDFMNGRVASWEKGCSFTRYVAGTLHHNCDSARGSSGASMFYFQKVNNTKTVYVVAIHVAEFRDGGNDSLSGITYSDSRSNVAIPASAFYTTYAAIKR